MRARRHLVTVAALVACAALPLSMPSSAEGREPLPSNISLGEPPKSNPAYYLRFCKSFSRMGGRMQYLQCDNLGFVQNLYHVLNKL